MLTAGSLSKYLKSAIIYFEFIFKDAITIFVQKLTYSVFDESKFE